MKLVLDTHIHTVSSGHAYSTVMEYVNCAKEKGLSLIAITDHAPSMPGTCHKFHFANLDDIPRMLNGVEVLGGVELNIMDETGRVDLPEGILKKLDVVIASLHIPCFAPKSEEEHTKAVINTMKKPLVKVIGHLGDPRYPINVEKVVKAAKETNTVIELNNNSFADDSPRADEGFVRKIIKCCKQFSVPVVMGSDSHFVTYLGEFSKVERLAIEEGLPEELVLNTSVELFKKTLGIE